MFFLTFLLNFTMDNEIMDFKDLPESEKVRIVFMMFPGFREWIDQTKLFTSIKEMTSCVMRHYDSSIKAFDATGLVIELQISKDKVVKIPDDLPLSLVENFFLNSPFKDTNPTFTNKHTNNILSWK